MDYIINSKIIKHLFYSLGTSMKYRSTREGLRSGYDAELQR